MIRKLSIAILLCICSFCSTAQICNNADTTTLRSYPSESDSSTYILTVKLRFTPFIDRNWAGCFTEPVLCKVITSSDPKLKGRYIPIMFTEQVIWLNSSQLYTVVMQPVYKERLGCSGSWKSDTCIRKVYWARTAVTTKEYDYEPFFKQENLFSCFGAPYTPPYFIKSKISMN